MSNSTSVLTTSSTSDFTTSSFTSDTFTSSSTIPTTSSTTSTTPTTTSTTPTSTSTTATSTATTASTTSSTSATATSTSVTSVATYTSRITITPTSGTASASVITITSTATPSVTSTGDSAASASASSASAASSSSRAAALATSSADSSNGSGISSGGKIAIAVVVPIVAIAAIVVALLFWWKRRKARKVAEEERRKEVEEYGYNPNNDPTLPAVGSTYGETQSEMTEDNSGYRGWGATSSTQRKPSTTMGSGRGAVGMALSDTTSNNGNYQQNSEGNSGDPLVSSLHDRPVTGDSDPVNAVGGGAPVAGAAAQQDRDINRGPSNASSAYTGQARSEASDEGERSPSGAFGSQYYDDGALYSEAQAHHGPYGDGSYGGGQPIIRDVQARRNTRIEKPSVFPQQGNAGISQNF